MADEKAPKAKTAHQIALDCVEDAAKLVSLAATLWGDSAEALDLLRGAEGDLTSVAAGTI